MKEIIREQLLALLNDRSVLIKHIAEDDMNDMQAYQRVQDIKEQIVQIDTRTDLLLDRLKEHE